MKFDTRKPCKLKRARDSLNYQKSPWQTKKGFDKSEIVVKSVYGKSHQSTARCTELTSVWEYVFVRVAEYRIYIFSTDPSGFWAFVGAQLVNSL